VVIFGDSGVFVVVFPYTFYFMVAQLQNFLIVSLWFESVDCSDCQQSLALEKELVVLRISMAFQLKKTAPA